MCTGRYVLGSVDGYFSPKHKIFPVWAVKQVAQQLSAMIIGKYIFPWFYFFRSESETCQSVKSTACFTHLRERASWVFLYIYISSFTFYLTLCTYSVFRYCWNSMSQSFMVKYMLTMTGSWYWYFYVSLKMFWLTFRLKSIALHWESSFEWGWLRHRTVRESCNVTNFIFLKAFWDYIRILHCTAMMLVVTSAHKLGACWK